MAGEVAPMIPGLMFVLIETYQKIDDAVVAEARLPEARSSH